MVFNDIEIGNIFYFMNNLLKLIRYPMGDFIKTFNSVNGPKAIGPYSTARIFNGTMYISGEIGIDPKTS